MTEKPKDLDSQNSDREKLLLEAMWPVADLFKQIQRAMQPFTDMQKQLQAIHAPAFGTPAFDSVIKQFAESQRRIAKAINGTQVWPLFEKIAKFERNTRALEAIGWLPHYSIPFDLVEECIGDTDALQTCLSNHFKERWFDVRQDIESRLAWYDVDEEAKATFREALDAHDVGHYRCVCRVLWPEIERIARIELHDDKLVKITSQWRLKELAENLSVTSIEPRGYYGLMLFRRLTEHLYAAIRNEDDRKLFALDPVPNRHAAIHGLVIYSTFQNSLNSIFMTDYVFQVISKLKNSTV